MGKNPYSKRLSRILNIPKSRNIPRPSQIIPKNNIWANARIAKDFVEVCIFQDMGIFQDLHILFPKTLYGQTPV